MGKVTGFLEYGRETPRRRPVLERVNDWFEVYQDFPVSTAQHQAARCMDCGVPFCHTGCPLNNFIPDWNDLVWKGRWREALRSLHATNNFPEFTGRICPAPCEAACVLGINKPAVTIKAVEQKIIDYGFAEGWVQPEPPRRRTGQRVAIVGSGPAGLAAAQQLCRAGHSITVLERHDRIGGLLRYGIPDFKMEKYHVDRRVTQMEAEGVTFHYGVHVGVNFPVQRLVDEYDAVVKTRHPYGFHNRFAGTYDVNIDISSHLLFREYQNAKTSARHELQTLHKQDEALGVLRSRTLDCVLEPGSRRRIQFPREHDLGNACTGNFQ